MLVPELSALESLESYRQTFEEEIDARMGEKLPHVAEPEDLALLTAFLQRMQQTRADYTRTFRALSRYAADTPASIAAAADRNRRRGGAPLLARVVRCATRAREFGLRRRHARTLRPIRSMCCATGLPRM